MCIERLQVVSEVACAGCEKPCPSSRRMTVLPPCWLDSRRVADTREVEEWEEEAEVLEEY